MKTKLFSKIVKTTTNISLFVLLILAFLLVGARLFDLKPYIVDTNNMEPSYPLGSLIYIKEVEFKDIEILTPITYIADENLDIKTNRVVDIDEKQQLFTIKADAKNEIEIKPVHYNNVLGSPQYMIPYLGFLYAYLQTTKGLMISLSLVLILALINLSAISYWSKKPKKSSMRKFNKK